MENLENFVPLTESDILSLISKNNEGITIQELVKQTSYSEKSIKKVLNKYITTNVIKIEDDKIVYTSPIEGDIVFLKGDTLLPVTFIDLPDALYVTRGNWYKLPKNFDRRRIVWDCELNNNGNSKNTKLVDLLVAHQILKNKKRKLIVQSDEYLDLVSKIVPYADGLQMQLLKIGDEITEVLFITNISIKKDDMEVISKSFKIKSEISTHELIEEINKPNEERNYQNINVNNIIDLNDILFIGNEIPISYDNDSLVRGEKLKYIKISKIKGCIEYSICEKSFLGDIEVIDTLKYELISDGVESILGMCKPFLTKNLQRWGMLLDYGTDE